MGDLSWDGIGAYVPHDSVSNSDTISTSILEVPSSTFILNVPSLRLSPLPVVSVAAMAVAPAVGVAQDRICKPADTAAAEPAPDRAVTSHRTVRAHPRTR